MGVINVRDYTVALPPKSAADVVKRELQVLNSGLAAVPITVEAPLGDPGPPSVDITVKEGQTGIRLELREIDNAGNVSEASAFEFSSLDDTPPPAPGAFGVTFAGERVVEVQDGPAPVPEPTPETPVV